MKSLLGLLPLVLLTAISTSAAGATVVVPAAAFALGANGAMWATEMRVTNLSDQPKTFRVVDWVGKTASLPFQTQEFQVLPGATQSYGGWALISPWVGIVVNYPSGMYFGAAVIEIDDALRVQTAVLSGVAFTPYTGAVIEGYHGCLNFEGGYPVYAYLTAPASPPGICNEGAGPLIDGTGDFFGPGATISLPWLHTDSMRRTNATFYNPDLVPATVTLSITPADGTAPVTTTVSVPAHDVLQLNDIFSSPPFDTVRAHNLPQNTAAARATINSTTRLFAVGWVISSQNNTVTISLPR